VQIRFTLRRKLEIKRFEGTAVSIFGARQLIHYNFAKTDKLSDKNQWMRVKKLEFIEHLRPHL
jgi:hypothetical protein